MAPKKSRKQDDEWEADLGETIDPASTTLETPNDTVENEDGGGNGGGGGGLMAAIKENKTRKQKKRDPLSDPADGQTILDLPSKVADRATLGNAKTDAAAKSLQEANVLDSDAVSDAKKSKVLPQRSKSQQGNDQPGKDASEEGDEDNRLRSKKEKEKEKKEREKQRKKEQVREK